MIQDTIELQDDDGIEDEAQGEVDKVLFEMTDGLLGQAGAVGADLEVCFLFLMSFSKI